MDIQTGGMLDRERLTDGDKKRKFVNKEYKPLGTQKQFPGDRIDTRPDPGKTYQKPVNSGAVGTDADGNKTVGGIVIEKPIAQNKRKFIK